MRREQDRPAPRRRRACYDDFWYFVTDPSNPQRLRSARAVLEAWFNGAVTRTLFCADRSGAGPASLPGTSPATPDRRRSGRAPEKAYDARTPQQHGRRESAAGSTPHRSAYCPLSGAFCAGEEGLSGDTAPVSYHALLVFIKLLTLSYPNNSFKR